MPVAIWDKNLIKVYLNPMTGAITDAHANPEWVPPMDVIGMTYASERQLAQHYPGIKFTIVGDKLPLNNTRTTKDSFGFELSEEEINKEKSKIGEEFPIITDQTKVYMPENTLKSMDELFFIFTQAAIEAANADGLKQKLAKKSYCNGIGKAIVTIYPDMEERLKRIVKDAKEKEDFGSTDSFFV